MRKSRLETAETRTRIVQAASVEFRRNGIAGTGLADVMAAAGMTHGGFYKHFSSKEQIIEESVSLGATTLADTVAKRVDEASSGDALKNIINNYLSKEHVEDVGNGCTFVALASELARSSDAVRDETTEGFLRVVGLISEQLKNMSRAAAKKEAIVMLSAMIGAVTMARVVNDPALSATILNETKKQLLNR